MREIRLAATPLEAFFSKIRSSGQFTIKLGNLTSKTRWRKPLENKIKD